ncbi:MAG TPA: type II secretion system protein GspM [Candidatus Binataceae bacterium]|nr:type II secretion system protein GspM [Candidatus Binataceae bacterium]
MLERIRELLGRLRDLAAWMRERIADLLGAVLGPQVARLRAVLDPHLRQLRAHYHRLEPREKLLVRIAAGLLGIFLAYNLIYLPIIGLRADLNQRVVERQHELLEVRAMTRTYLRLKSELAVARKRTVPGDKDFSLFSVVEKALSDSVGHDKLGSITPGVDRKVADGMVASSVDLQLTNLSLQQLVDALYRLQTLSVPIRVSTIHIKRRFQDPHSFDVDMTCVALAKNA